MTDDPLAIPDKISEAYLLELIRNLRDIRFSLQGDHESSYLPLYRVVMQLYRLYWADRKRFLQVTGYKTLPAMADAELDLKQRSMKYLISIAKMLFVVLKDHVEQREKLVSLGHTRLLIIANLITPVNADAWYDFARTHSKDEIKQAARDYRRALGEKDGCPNINEVYEYIPLTT